jgi:diacylglycerol kinase family enzyme
MRATLVHNPTAGTGSPTTEELVEILASAGISAHACSPKDKDLQNILAHAPELVVAAGGDGTIAKVITNLKNRATRVAILPLGTGNNIARAFGITGPIEEVVAGWEQGREQKLDVGVATGPFEQRRFVEAVGVGALAVTTAKKVKEEGTIAKQVERGRDLFRKTLRNAKPIKVKLMLDDRPLKEEVLLLEVMNIGFVGPGLRLATRADPGDGRFDVIFVPADCRNDMLDWTEEPDRRAAPVTVESARSVTLRANGGAMLRVGDKAMPEAEGEMLIEIEHPPVTLLVPSPPKRKSVAVPAKELGENANDAAAGKGA